MMYLKVVIGFVVLVIAAEVLVRGAVYLASRLGVSKLVIGMTVVAMGTSAPELVVSLDAAKAGASSLAVGNLVGSNIANVLLILGLSCLITPMLTKASALKRDGFTLFAGTVVFVALAMQGELSLIAGSILIAGFFAFLTMSYWRESHDPEAASAHVHEVEELQGQINSLPISIVAVVLGLGGLMWGADILVDGGVDIARTFGVSEAVIGLTLFAFGTSLPELAASGVAAYRGHTDVAVGNIVGSNMFNLLAVGGIVALVEPLEVIDQIRNFDLWVMLVSTMIVLPLLFWGWRINRFGGAIFFALYLVYVSIQGYGVDKTFALITG